MFRSGWSNLSNCVQPGVDVPHGDLGRCAERSGGVLRAGGVHHCTDRPRRSLPQLINSTDPFLGLPTCTPSLTPSSSGAK